MNERHVEMARSDYQRDNQYSAIHPDARASSGNGKGTGHGGHTHWLPNCTGQIGIIRYTNFDTAITSGAGNDCDNVAREKALSRSLYNNTRAYGLVDTSRNVNEGQYVNVYKPKSKRNCY